MSTVGGILAKTLGNDNDNDFIASKHIHSEWLWQTCNGIHHYQVNVIKHIKNT